MRPVVDYSLYLVTDPDQCAKRGVLETVVAAVRGGVSLVQLRDKNASDEELIGVGKTLKAILAPLGAPLIINDRIAVAKAVGADGVHVGQEDTSVLEARSELGQTAIIGLSVNRMPQALNLDTENVDYIGCGPVRATQTKSDHKTPIGVTGATMMTIAVSLPVVAIGGVDKDLARTLMSAGFDGVAVVSAICSADDPEAAARALREQVDAGRAERNV